MSRYVPPFTITPQILNQVVEIGELLGHWAAQTGRASPLLRKKNRIRTIQASLAIEHNSLTTNQVTAVLEGKRVLAPVKDIQEVRNAIKTYERMSSWKSHRVADLLEAHGLLMQGLVDTPGQLRSSNVGIYRDTQLIHMAPPASRVSLLIDDLLAWLKTTELHPLVASSVFHYEFEFIHPFADGNGRMGRLWQTLILSEWRSELAWLPVETIIHYQQERYYQVLGECERTCDCTPFVVFMLSAVTAALVEGLNPGFTLSEKVSEEASEEIVPVSTREKAILQALREQPALTAVALAGKLGLSARSIERYLSSLQQKRKLERVGAKKGGYWQVK